MNHKRTSAYRRHKKWVNFKRRLINWTNWYYDPQRKAEDIEEALNGKAYTFLQTTGCPCNCYMCSGYNKYKRPKKQDILKEAYKDIDDMAL